MLELETYLQTRERGLAPAAALPPQSVLWTGEDWSNADVAVRPRQGDAVTITFADGGQLVVAVDAALKLFGKERYYWKDVRELRPGDRVCLTMSVGSALSHVGFARRTRYYTGLLFGAGRPTKTGAEVPLRTRAVGAEVEQELQEFCRDSRLKASIVPGEDCPVLRFSGRHAQEWMRQEGIWWNEDGRVGAVPAAAQIDTPAGRRAFCRGALDACGQDLERNWVLQLDSEQRMAGYQLMLRSAGMPSTRLGLTAVRIAQWVASLELNTSTPYPSRNEMVSGSTPLHVIEEFCDAVERRKQQRWSLEAGVASTVRGLIEERQDIHPLMLAAAWSNLRAKPYSPIHASVEVISVLPRHDETSLIDIRIADTSHALDANGYVVGDTMR